MIVSACDMYVKRSTTARFESLRRSHESALDGYNDEKERQEEESSDLYLESKQYMNVLTDGVGIINSHNLATPPGCKSMTTD